MRPSSDCGPERGPETSWSSTKSFLSTQKRFPNCEGSRDLQSLGLQLNITLELNSKETKEKQ